jgi:integrase
MAGSIAKRANGKWRARYRDEAGREHSRHFDRKIDAQQWLDQVTSAVVTGTYADPKAGRITFAAFFGEWSARQVWAPGTVLAMSLAARSVPLAGKPMKQVRHSDVETWIKQMDAAGLAPGTIKTRYVNVRSVFRAAVKDRVIGSDPTDGVRLPRGRRADVAMSIPPPEEVGQLMAVADERIQPFIALCAFAGLRLGEAAGVQLGDVDFLRRSLKVSRQVQRVNGGAVEVRAPKYGSERVVYLADSLVNALAEHITAHGTTGKDRWLFAWGGRRPAASEHRRLVAQDAARCRPVGRQAPRPAALLRLRPHRGRLRRGDRPAVARPREGDDNPQHLRPPLADCRGPHEEGGGVDHVRVARRANCVLGQLGSESGRVSCGLGPRLGFAGHEPVAPHSAHCDAGSPTVGFWSCSDTPIPVRADLAADATPGVREQHGLVEKDGDVVVVVGAAAAEIDPQGARDVVVADEGDVVGDDGDHVHSALLEGWSLVQRRVVRLGTQWTRPSRSQ